MATVIQAQMVNEGEQVLGAPTRAERAELTALYQAGGDLPSGSTPRAGQAARRSSPSCCCTMRDRRVSIRPTTGPTRSICWRTDIAPRSGRSEDLAAFDMAMSGAMLRYLRHLHLGRIDPRTIGFRLHGVLWKATTFCGTAPLRSGR